MTTTTVIEYNSNGTVGYETCLDSSFPNF